MHDLLTAGDELKERGNDVVMFMPYVYPGIPSSLPAANLANVAM